MATSKTKKEGKAIAPRKLKMFQEIVTLSNEYNSLLISSARNITSAQLQKIRNNLKGKAVMKVVKKQIMLKAIEEISKTKSAIKDLGKYIEESSILLFSNLSPFELAVILADNRVAKKAKAGQVSPQDIEVEPGPTDMPAGPMITELSSVGLKVAIENGKISIKEPKIVVKQDEKISEVVASILLKLGITPFTAELETLGAYDGKEGKIYAGIRINREETEKQIKVAFSNSRALAFSIAYPAKEIIGLLLARAVAQAMALEGLSKTDTPISQTPEIPSLNAQ